MMDSSSGDKIQASRANVAERYHAAVKERELNPDRLFFDGEDLRVLDANLVTLSSKAGDNPRSWKTKKKWTVTILVGVYVFLGPFTSTIFAPSLHSVMADLGETNPALGAIQIAIFVLAFAIAPIFLAPISEIVGRRLVLTGGNLLFITFCLGGGFCQKTAQLAVCRFLAGCGGSAALAAFGGVLADIWDLEDRAKASAIVGIATMMGPVLGPACGGWISERASWRWTCWAPAAAAVVLEIVAVFFYKESYIPALLRLKLAKEKKSRPDALLYTVLDLESPSSAKRNAASVLESSGRPAVYLALDPVLMILSVYLAFIFGVLYLVIVTFESVFGRGYGFSPGIVGVCLLAEGLGGIIGMLATTKLLDIIYKRQKKEKYKLESRLISAFPGALLAGAGLFMYGFTAQRTHFSVPLIGVLIFSSGMTNTYLAVQLYIIDGFDYPASAMTGLNGLRFLFAGTFPLFGQRMFDSLGIDWGVGMLAFMSFGLGLPFLPLIYVYGPRLRDMGKRNRSRIIG